MPSITATPASSLTSQPRTCAPSVANSRASALPRPEATPVTITLRPSNVPMPASPRWSSSRFGRLGQSVNPIRRCPLCPDMTRSPRVIHTNELGRLGERERPQREPELADVAGGSHRAARQLLDPGDPVVDGLCVDEEQFAGPARRAIALWVRLQGLGQLGALLAVVLDQRAEYAVGRPLGLRERSREEGRTAVAVKGERRAVRADGLQRPPRLADGVAEVAWTDERVTEPGTPPFQRGALQEIRLRDVDGPDHRDGDLADLTEQERDSSDQPSAGESFDRGWTAVDGQRAQVAM